MPPPLGCTNIESQGYSMEASMKHSIVTSGYQVPCLIVSSLELKQCCQCFTSSSKNGIRHLVCDIQGDQFSGTNFKILPSVGSFMGLGNQSHYLFTSSFSSLSLRHLFSLPSLLVSYVCLLSLGEEKERGGRAERDITWDY